MKKINYAAMLALLGLVYIFMEVSAEATAATLDTPGAIKIGVAASAVLGTTGDRETNASTPTPEPITSTPNTTINNQSIVGLWQDMDEYDNLWQMYQFIADGSFVMLRSWETVVNVGTNPKRYFHYEARKGTYTVRAATAADRQYYEEQIRYDRKNFDYIIVLSGKVWTEGTGSSTGSALSQEGLMEWYEYKKGSAENAANKINAISESEWSTPDNPNFELRLLSLTSNTLHIDSSTKISNQNRKLQRVN